jgi:GNAT superfamily N-acetyltransferase
VAAEGATSPSATAGLTAAHERSSSIAQVSGLITGTLAFCVKAVLSPRTPGGPRCLCHSEEGRPKRLRLDSSPVPLDERPTVEVRDVRASETPAVALLARGMRDNPLNVAVYGSDPARRQRSVERTFSTLFRVSDAQQPICALDGGTLVAVTGVAPAGSCQPSMLQRLRSLPSMIAIGPWPGRASSQGACCLGRARPRSAALPPRSLAVDPHLQGRGIGSQIMNEYWRRLDVSGEAGYLETDKQENVPFYERDGYAVIDRADVIGVPNWFMIRRPQRSA